MTTVKITRTMTDGFEWKHETTAKAAIEYVTSVLEESTDITRSIHVEVIPKPVKTHKVARFTLIRPAQKNFNGFISGMKAEDLSGYWGHKTSLAIQADLDADPDSHIVGEAHSVIPLESNEPNFDKHTRGFAVLIESITEEEVN